METKELAKKGIQSTNGNGKSDEAIMRVAKNLQNQVSKVTSQVSNVTSKVTSGISSDPLLWAGFGCLGVSLFLRATGLRTLGRLIGQVATPILIMGLYNKVIKLEGSEGSA